MRSLPDSAWNLNPSEVVHTTDPPDSPSTCVTGRDRRQVGGDDRPRGGVRRVQFEGFN